MINGLCVRMSTAAKVLFTPALFTLITSTRQPTACRSEDVTDTNKRQKVRMKQEIMLANKSFLLTDSYFVHRGLKEMNELHELDEHEHI